MATLTDIWTDMANGRTGIYDNKEYYILKADKEVLLLKPYGKRMLFYKGMLGNGWSLKEIE